MTQITLNSSAITQLLQVHSPVEILDDKGNVIGHFQPVQGFQLSSEPGLSEAEVERRLKQPGRPLTDILRDLETRQ